MLALFFLLTGVVYEPAFQFIHFSLSSTLYSQWSFCSSTGGAQSILPWKNECESWIKWDQSEFELNSVLFYWASAILSIVK